MTGVLLSVDAQKLLAGQFDAVQRIEGDGLWVSPDRGLAAAIAVSSSGRGRQTLPENERNALAQRVAERYGQRRSDWIDVGNLPLAGVVVDIGRRLVTAAVDAAGVHQMFHTSRPGRIVAATHLANLLSELKDAPAISPQSVFDYVYFHVIPSPSTLYRGVYKLQAGHTACYDEKGPSVRRHFAADFSKDPPMSLDRQSVELVDKIQSAVQRSLVPNISHGAFLSGGLDSSTVAGMLARTSEDARVPTFSIGFDADGYDEIKYARIAANHFGTASHEYYVTPGDVASSIRDIVTAFDEPFGNSSVVPVYFCAKLARENGVQRLLAGDGGDELFAGNGRYAKQLLFERYLSLPAWLRTRLLEPILVDSALARTPGLAKIANYARQARIGLPDRLQSYNYLHRHAPADVFTMDFLSQVDTASPLQGLREEYDVHPEADPVDRMLFLDWKFTLHDNDLVKVNTACGFAGVDVAYPMIDPELVRFSSSIPGAVKLKGGQLRWFYKHSFKNFLPESIINKPKHGFGLPFGVWMKQDRDLRKLSDDALESLRERGVFNPGFLANLPRLHREEHAAYYGELLWVLTVMELWFQHHAPHAQLR